VNAKRHRVPNQSVMTTLMEVAGAALTVAGAFVAVGTGLALVAAGAWLLLFGWLIGDGSDR